MKGSLILVALAFLILSGTSDLGLQGSDIGFLTKYGVPCREPEEGVARVGSQP